MNGVGKTMSDELLSKKNRRDWPVLRDPWEPTFRKWDNDTAKGFRDLELKRSQRDLPQIPGLPEFPLREPLDSRFKVTGNPLPGGGGGDGGGGGGGGVGDLRDLKWDPRLRFKLAEARLGIDCSFRGLSPDSLTPRVGLSRFHLAMGIGLNGQGQFWNVSADLGSGFSASASYNSGHDYGASVSFGSEAIHATITADNVNGEPNVGAQVGGVVLIGHH